jgi:hypothetical protein
LISRSFSFHKEEADILLNKASYCFGPFLWDSLSRISEGWASFFNPHKPRNHMNNGVYRYIEQVEKYDSLHMPQEGWILRQEE